MANQGTQKYPTNWMRVKRGLRLSGDLLKMLPHLEELGLDSTEVDDHGAQLLASISTLKSLDLYHTLVSDSGYRAIKSALPQCQIFWDKDSSLTSRRKL